MTTLIISNEKINDIIKIVKSPEELDLLITDISGKIKMELKLVNLALLGLTLLIHEIIYLK